VLSHCRTGGWPDFVPVPINFGLVSTHHPNPKNNEHEQTKTNSANHYDGGVFFEEFRHADELEETPNG
jgi:hypothetical protein